MEKEEQYRNRNGLKVMYKLIGLVLPLLHVMVAAITMGVIGFLTAIFIIVLGGVGLLNILGFASHVISVVLFVSATAVQSSLR